MLMFFFDAVHEIGMALTDGVSFIHYFSEGRLPFASFICWTDRHWFLIEVSSFLVIRGSTCLIRSRESSGCHADSRLFAHSMELLFHGVDEYV